MPRVTGPQKLDRILRFLAALRDEALSGPLVAAGMKDRDLEEGWSLLRGVSPRSIAAARLPLAEANDAVAALDAWVARFVKLLEPAIARRYPALHRTLYEGLPHIEGPGVALLVEGFLDRLDALGTGAEETDLRALLRTRGLDEHAVTEARRLVRAAMGVDLQASLGVQDYEKAEADAWAWYGEWTAVARAHVRDGRVLHRLGLSAEGREE